MYEIGFIGCGNMGGALAKAVAHSVDPKTILLANRTAEKAQTLAKELGCACGSNEDVAKNCRYIFLGIKPGMMEGVLTDLQATLAKRKDFVLITMAAGLSIDEIQRMAGGSYPVIRIMPNTPVSIGKGMILASTSPEVSEADGKEFTDFMRGCGVLDFLPESLIDAGTALSGCGPAYVDMFIEALADGGVSLGLPREKALTYACQTLIGAASLVTESGEHPEVLKDKVCSPGGSTIAGVQALEEEGFRGIVIDGIEAAYDRTMEMKAE